MAALQKKYQEVFAAIDTDKDGKLSKSEIAEAIKKTGRNMSEEELTQEFAKIDKNNSGYVDKEEFSQMMGEIKKKEEKNMKEAFAKFDKDGNGFISTSELQQTMQELKVTISRDEAAEMISSVDCDNDGKVSFNEFQKMMAMV